MDRYPPRWDDSESVIVPPGFTDVSIALAALHAAIEQVRASIGRPSPRKRARIDETFGDIGDKMHDAGHDMKDMAHGH
jgi:hypothetical protein